MKKNVNVRELILEEFKNSLEENSLMWYQGWNTVRHQNIKTKKSYKGFNQILLMYYSFKEDLTSNQWGTFNQLKEMNLKLEKGSKGKLIAFYSYYDKVNKKTISFSEYDKELGKGRKSDEFKFVSRNYNIFNLSNTVDFDETERSLSDFSIIEKYLERNKVIYKEIVSDEAYYMPSKHTVVMPLRESFIHDNIFYTTLFHEVAHSTKNVVLRDVPSELKTKEELYAFEELVAEVTSVLLSCELGVELYELDNHKAYIQSWANAIDNNPQYLFKAISNAEKIVDYITNIN